MLQHSTIAPSEIDAMPYYEYQWYFDDMQEILEAKRKANEKSGDSHDNYDVNAMQKNAMRQQQSMMKDVLKPNIGNLTIPNF